MRPTTAFTPALAPIDNPYALLEAHFAASPTGILIVAGDGEIQTYNDRFLQLWGLTPEVAGRAGSQDLLLYMSSQVADCESFIASTRRFHENRDEEMYGEVIQLGNSRTLSCNTRPVKDAEGLFIGRIWDFQDITDVIAARDQLRLARYTLDHAMTPVFWIEEDGSLAAANRAAADSLGYEENELQQMRVWDINPERTAGRWARLWQEVKESGETVFPSSQMRSDGTTFPVEVTAHFFRFERTELVCGFVRDLTEEREAEEERHRLEQSIQQAQKFEGLALLAGGVAHDFNNLLVGVLGNASLALESTHLDEDLKTCLEEIQDAGQHATALTDQMLAYAGRTQLELEHVDLSEMVNGTLRLLQVGVDKDCHVETKLADGLPSVEVDATQIRQVLVNLVTNGSEALRGSEGTVTISTHIEDVDGEAIAAAQLSSNTEPGRFVAIEVRDTGAGMDSDTIDRIFDPFFSTKLSAHGLGLAAVRGIVHQHRGLLRIESTVGAGSTFSVLLPAKARPARTPKLAVSSEPWTGSGKVLLIDDNRRVLEVGRRMLEILGFSVVTCESGEEAIGLFQHDGSEFCLAIIDMTMPQMDGSEVARILREIRPDQPILLSSGYSKFEVVSQSAAEQEMAYLPKPYTLEDLKLRIQAMPQPSDAADDSWLD